jgi:hypothetical protein
MEIMFHHVKKYVTSWCVCYQFVFPRSHSLQFTLVIQATLDTIGGGGDLHRKGDSLLHVDHITSQFNFQSTLAGNTV